MHFRHSCLIQCLIVCVAVILYRIFQYKYNMSQSAFVDIDGSLLEGGGQILRMSLTLSTLCGIPVRVYNIRGGRSKPGLRPQHLQGLKLISAITQAEVKGDEIGSTEIEFRPKSITGGFYHSDIQTAGSVGLLLQVALPCAYFANSDTTLKLRGGTNAEMAPQIDYTTEVFRLLLEKFNVSFDFDLITRGYFPKGGGEVSIAISPTKWINPITLLEQGNLTKVYGWSFVAGNLHINMTHKMADSATRIIKKAFPSVNINIERYKERPSVAVGTCAGIILVAETTTGCVLGSSALWKKSTTPEEWGTSAAHELVNSVKDGACVDQYGQDQIIVFMALAKGMSQVRIGKMTKHTETAIYIAEKLTKAKFEVTNNGSNSVLKCEGIGLENKYV